MIRDYENRTEFLAWIDFGIRIIYTKKSFGDVMMMSLPTLQEKLNLPLEKTIITGKQTHSDHIAMIQEKDIVYFEDNDGFITDREDVILYTKYADCMPVFLLDRKQKKIAVVHSGWKGSFQRIACKALTKMSKYYRTKVEDIEVVFGVGISQEHYEVGEEYFYDNQEFIAQTLLECGVKEEKIFRNHLCSFEGDYHSYRRDREGAGRNGAFIYFEK